MNRSTKILSELFIQARDLENGYRTRLVSRIDLKGRPISYGYNSTKSHTFQSRYAADHHKIFWHSETMAIFNALKVIDVADLAKATLYVARAKSQGDKQVCALAKPCDGCMKAINHFGIKKVFYTCDAIDSSNEIEYGLMTN